MFTGIVAAIGKITSITPQGAQADAGVRLTLDAGGLPLADVALGDSIALNGACMTVVAKTETGFCVEVSRESLNCTAGLDALGEVNLEKALTLADRLGGGNRLAGCHCDRAPDVGLRYNNQARFFTEIGEHRAQRRPAEVQEQSVGIARRRPRGRDQRQEY